MAFSTLRHIRASSKQQVTKDTPYVYSNEVFTLLDNVADASLKLNIFQDYGFDDPSRMTISGSEFLKQITVADFGNLYNTAVALTNLQLMYPNALSAVFDMDKDRLTKITEKDKANDKCSSYIIAKKYYSKEALLEDNEKPVFFDKDYDTTNYDLINEKYRKQREQLSNEDFILFLTEEFMTKKKMDEQSAEYIAETLVNQAKRVREGDFALLVNTTEDEMPDSLEYYVRNNDIWVLDKDIDPNAFIEDSDILCNIQNINCISNPALKEEDKCESLNVAKDTIIKNTLSQILEQFDKNYNISKEELNTQIHKHLNYYSKTFDKLQALKRKQFFKYNDQKYEIGLTVTDDLKERIVSPYVKLRDLIMGQNDFIKKQTDIIRFVSLYCRAGDPTIPNIHDGEMESEWWLYCKETNTKLLPGFYFILADAFITKNSEYENVLNQLKRDIGKLGDDGDAWVDKHSGEIICYVDYDVSEGYKDGFVDRSRDLIEQDVGEIIIEQQKDKQKVKKRLSPEGEIVSNIISIMSSNMGINIESSRDFIIKVVTELVNDTKILEKEPAYRKREEEAAKKGKKLPTYTLVYSSTLIYLSLGMYLVGIQTSIPSVKTRKTAPGCVRSFTGFPFEGEGDDSALNYVACVALKSRDPTTIPWNALPKSEEKIAATIKSFIIRYLLPYGEVEQKIKEKTEYILVEPDEDIPEEYNVNKWTNFLPPLKRFHVKHLENVSAGFTEELQNELYTGNHRQLEKILVVESKIIAFSLAIQEAIQKLIEKKALLLKSGGQMFMDNACCNERGKNTLTTLQYFVEEDKNIEFYNTIVYQLSALIKDIKTLTQSAIMISEVNTKRSYPSITTEFSEETIYQAFIVLCKFQSTIPLGEELAAICVDKPDYLKKLDSIQEKIAQLKRDGRNYTKEQFLRLFQIVSRNNIIRMSLNIDNISCTTRLRELLTRFDEENNENVPKVLVQRLDRLMENADVLLEEDTKDMRLFKDYLATANDRMRKDVLSFLKSKAKLTGIELKNITKFLTDLTIWNFDTNPRNTDIKISDDALYNYTNFFKNFIELFSIVFPTMIINQQLHTIDPPKYWGLSRDHVHDVMEMVSGFYKPLEKFYGNNTIKNVLREIQNKSRPLHLLSKYTPIFSNIKIGEKELHGIFEKRTVTLLYEYYFLSLLNEYVALTQDPSLISRILVAPTSKDPELFSGDFLVEQQMRFTEDEQEFMEGDVVKLKQEVAKLMSSYLTIMMRSKKTINVSYDDVEDRVFKLKEAEKYTFTDRLRDMTEEERAVDTILKHHKLGALYSIGLSKGIKEYDPENFDHDKKVAEKVAEIQNRLKRQRRDADGELDDALEELETDRGIEEDLAMDANETEDYNDGDPWGDEYENREDYD